MWAPPRQWQVCVLTRNQVLIAAVLLLPAFSRVSAADAEEPIYGGLGLTLGEVLEHASYGAEIATVPSLNLIEASTKLAPGTHHPWHYLSRLNLPRPLREISNSSYVMLNDETQIMHIVNVSHVKGCDNEFAWLKATLAKKYRVQSDVETEPANHYQRSLNIDFLSKQIYVHCGPELVIGYLDNMLIEAWREMRKTEVESRQGHLPAVAKSRLLIKQRKIVSFANTFAMGDRFHLDGAFGIQFRTPFAKNSKQAFPIDQPFYAGLPDLPKPFDQGEIQLVISPKKHPIVIRGIFDDIKFELLANALKEKYGMPSKNTPRHIIHKIGNSRAIVKKLSESKVELAFIDTHAQAEQRRRLWEQESDGL